MPTEAEIAWAAGLFEGEGSIVFVKNTAVSLKVEMTDLDVLEHFRDIVDAGSITDKTCTNPKPQWKQRYMWQVYARDDVKRILVWFRPYLLPRRGAKADGALKRLERNPGSHAAKTHCIHGHAFTPENTYRYSGDCRRCKTCHRERVLARYYRLKAAA